MTDSLSLTDFEAYFRDVHGHAPFTWQTELLEQVLHERAWPDVVDLPTASGKTAMLDIALFAFAAGDAGAPWSPRRIAMVVDRRVIVDQAHERARRIRAALITPSGPGAAQVAQRLHYLAGDPETPDAAEAVAVARLRGGVGIDTSWVRRPDQAALVSSTVDQLGSRLLFRGYGVSTTMRPVHAGLLGNDTLVLLDEVHLSEPFAQTLRALRDNFRGGLDSNVDGGGSWSIVELSATPASSGRRRFAIDVPALVQREPDGLLTRRVTAAKPAELVELKGGTANLVKFVSRQVKEAVVAEHVRVMAVVVNRVATAQAVHAALGRESGLRVELLTSRFRPLDRDERMETLTSKLRSGRDRDASQDQKPLVVVATQCIEAGADFDFDAMITECASLDALRQRFGRVDRLGDLSAAGTPAPSWVFHTPAPPRPDPVYGESLEATWKWLRKLPLVDFGTSRLELPAEPELSQLRCPTGVAPVLRESELDRWVQTSPVPVGDPDPALWLHGLGSERNDVQVLWRADLNEEQLRGMAGDEPSAELSDLLATVRPTDREAVSVPVAAFRAWVAGSIGRELAEAGVMSDVEGGAVSAPDVVSTAIVRPFVRWSGMAATVSTRASSVRPGDTVVVPSAYGGYRSDRGWDPSVLESVNDLGDLAQALGRRRLVLRMDARLWHKGNPLQAGDLEDLEISPGRFAERWLQERFSDGQVPDWVGQTVPVENGRLRVGRVDLREVAGQLVLIGRTPLPAANTDAQVESVTTEPDTSSFASVSPELAAHLAGVGELAERFARRCGLPDDLVADLRLAGELHDVGKVDPRFQLMMYGGDPAAQAKAGGMLIAKSRLAPHDRKGQHAARTKAGYPAGTRHELLSLAMLERSAELARRAHDWDLVKYLVASHHGHGRPFAPASEEPVSQEVSVMHLGIELGASTGHRLGDVGSPVAERFWVLVRRYGWHRLAFFETVLRLADHRRSAAEQMGTTS